MKFTPMSEEEIQEAGLLAVGEYDFEILSAKEKTSSKGNNMFELQVNVFDKNGTGRNILDWITPSFMKKFKHCLDACGLVTQYEKGEIIPDDFVGKSGKLKINIGEYENDMGDTIKTSRIHDYVKRIASQSEVNQVLEGDECPF